MNGPSGVCVTPKRIKNIEQAIIPLKTKATNLKKVLIL
jgi:hypothetical protein